ncbi:ribonuclease HII [Maribacter sp. CXY002]|uniref:ribonuclease HII n=1 Tax=Maribacter luteocoastalis TaxID=3407671 RepID=UPI003B6783E7
MRFKILLLFSIVLFFNCSTKNKKNDSLLDFVPKNSTLILKINDFESLASEIKENDLIDRIKKLPFSEELKQILKPLQYLTIETDGLFTLSLNKDNMVDFTFISNDSIMNLALDSIPNKTIETIIYNDIELKKFDVEGTVFYTSTIRNKEILSSSLILLKNIKDNQKNAFYNIPDKKIFRLKNVSKLAHVWLNLEKSDELLKLINDNSDTIQTPQYAHWLSLDISIENDGLYFNGVGITNDSVANYLGLFSKTKPLPYSTLTLTPDAADSYSSIGIHEFRQFAKNQNIYQQNKIASDSLLSAVEEIGLFTQGSEKLLLLKTYGTDQLFDYIKQIETNTTDYQGSEIVTLEENAYLSNSLNPILKDYIPKYATIIENTVLFATNLDALQSCIANIKNGTTFEKSPLYINSEDILAKESTSLSLSNYSAFKTNLADQGFSQLSKDLNAVKLENYLFGSQIVVDDGFFHTTYFIKNNSKTSNKTGVSSFFKLQLDTDILVDPQFVINHRTNKKEIVLQDQDNILYLISTNGKVLWKKQLESAIQGTIHQVDIYNNGKLQLAFTTNNRFYIVDRNGKEVQPFTFKFEGGNLNPLAVFDYEGKKNYRFVVTQNKKVFMYDAKGKIVSGFTYTNAESDILDAPQHFRIAQKDFLVFKLANGTLKILNRVGKDRIQVAEKIHFSENDVQVYNNQFTITSNEGILYHIDTNGKMQKIDLKLNPDHGLDATAKTLVIMNDNILSIRDKKVDLELGVYSKPTIFYLNDKIYISVTDIQNQKLYLFDSQAKSIPDFPIYGTSIIDMTDMDNDRKLEVVTQDQKNSIIVYQMN